MPEFVTSFNTMKAEDEQADEIGAAMTADGITMMAVPTELVGKVRAIIARKQSA